MHHLRSVKLGILIKLTQSIMDQIVVKKGGSYKMKFICSLHTNYLQKRASYHKKKQYKLI